MLLERVRRAPGGPSISTKNGDVTLTVGKDNAINFQVGSKTVDATAIPDALRGYTDATVAATQLGFDQGLAQGTAQGKVYALEVKTELTSELAKIQQSMSDLVAKGKADAIVAAKTMKEAKEANDKAAKDQVWPLLHGLRARMYYSWLGAASRCCVLFSVALST